MRKRYRRVFGIIIVAISVIFWAFQTQFDSGENYQYNDISNDSKININESELAREALEKIPVKGRAPKTNYKRSMFGDGWAKNGDCDTRNIILNRDLKNVTIGEKCKVLSGLLHDPYTGKDIEFKRGADTSSAVQIDHVVALSNAWQTGAQYLDESTRIELANDPLELLAVDGPANQAKSDGDAATWLPSNKAFRCQYISRQIAVKLKYNLWVTSSEKDAMNRVLDKCPDERLPTA